MKKKVVLLVSSFMFLLLSFMAVNGFYVNQNSDKERHVYAKPLEQVLGSRNLPAPADHEEAFYRTQADSVKIYNQLLEKFAEEEQPDASLMKAEAYEGIAYEAIEEAYPDYYGGAYIDQETGGLVVLVKEKSLRMDLASRKIASLTNKTTQVNGRSTDTAVRLEACEVSYKEMLAVQEFLTEQIESLSDGGIEITLLAIDIMKGAVVVSIKDLNEEKMAVVSSLADCSFLQFEEGDYVKEEEAIGGGYEIRCMETHAKSTIGFPAKRMEQYGYVIAGHAGNVVGRRFTYNGEMLGTVRRSAYYMYSKADAAFLVAEPGITITNVLKNGGAIWAAGNDALPVGTNVSMYGAVSKLQRGKILSTDVMIKNENNMLFQQQWKADYASQGGDSGAPILFYEGNYGGQSKYTLYGIHQGSDDYKNVYFSPYKNIVDALGISNVTTTKTVPYK